MMRHMTAEVNAPRTIRTVRDLPSAARPRELHRCKRSRCSRTLGRFHLRELPGGFWQLVDGNRWFRSETRPWTGTGLSLETYDDISYIRIRCKCGRDEKLRIEKYLELPVVEEPEGPVVYL
jgi:hypothetical protein